MLTLQFHTAESMRLSTSLWLHFTVATVYGANYLICTPFNVESVEALMPAKY